MMCMCEYDCVSFLCSCLFVSLVLLVIWMVMDVAVQGSLEQRMKLFIVSVCVCPWGWELGGAGWVNV